MVRISVLNFRLIALMLLLGISGAARATLITATYVGNNYQSVYGATSQFNTGQHITASVLFDDSALIGDNRVYTSEFISLQMDDGVASSICPGPDGSYTCYHIDNGTDYLDVVGGVVTGWWLRQDFRTPASPSNQNFSSFNGVTGQDSTFLTFSTGQEGASVTNAPGIWSLSSAVAIPEPAALPLMLLGLLVLCGVIFRRKDISTVRTNWSQ